MSLTPVQLGRGAAVLGLVVAWAVLSHLSSAGYFNTDFAIAFAVIPALVVVAMLLQRVGSRLVIALVCLALIGATIWIWPELRQNVAMLYFIQHVGTNLALATLFGRTLLGEQEALVTHFARLAHNGVISKAKARYTRQVTKAWTAFFLATSIVSTGLFWLAPAEAWSVFANLLSMPLLGLMFIGEHLIRVRVLPPADCSSIADTIRGYRASMERQRVDTAHQP